MQRAVTLHWLGVAPPHVLLLTVGPHPAGQAHAFLFCSKSCHRAVNLSWQKFLRVKLFTGEVKLGLFFVWNCGLAIIIIITAAVAPMGRGR